MAIRLTSLLVLSFALLACGHPYYGVKRPLRNYDQSYGKYDFDSSEEVVDKAKGFHKEEEIEVEDEPSTGYEDQKEPDYVPDHPDQKDTYKEPDYVPEIKEPDYVPEVKEPDYVPEVKEPDYVPEVKEPDYIPEVKEPDYVPEVKEPDYVPEQKEPDYVSEVKEPDYVPEQKEPDYVPEVKEPDYIPDHKDPYPYEDKVPDYVPEEKKEKTWIQRLHEKWNRFEDKSRETARAIGHSFHTAFEKLKNKFKHAVTNSSLMIQQGVQFVIKVVTTTVEEVKASHLISKLEQRLEQGNEIVDGFFQKVGEKMTHYMEQHGHKNVDEGFFDQDQTGHLHYQDIFKDPEIHQQINKMVDDGIITQEEADMFSQSKHDVFPDKGIEEKHDLGLEGKVIEHEGSGTFLEEHPTDKVVEDKTEHDSGAPSYGHGGSVTQDKTDAGSSVIHNEDQTQHHSIKKELEEDSHVDVRQKYPQIEEIPTYTKKGGHGINFPTHHKLY